MSGITVTLTTTKYSIASDDESIGLQTLDYPICVADFYMISTSSQSERERFEHQWSQIAQTMAKIVVIDSEKNSIYIGDQPVCSDNALVEYSIEQKNKYEEHFFKRWQQTEKMLFEFTVKSENGTLFSLNGLWLKDKWFVPVEINPTEKITVA